MAGTDAALERFFREYAAASVNSPAARVPGFYAESFIAAGPKGSAIFRNDESFVQWLGEMHEFNRRTGMVSMEAVSVEAPVLLSSRHLLVRVEWGARFTKTGDRLIAFGIAYLLENLDGKLRILAFVSEKDQEEEMREARLP